MGRGQAWSQMISTGHHIERFVGSTGTPVGKKAFATQRWVPGSCSCSRDALVESLFVALLLFLIHESGLLDERECIPLHYIVSIDGPLRSQWIGFRHIFLAD